MSDRDRIEKELKRIEKEKKKIVSKLEKGKGNPNGKGK